MPPRLPFSGTSASASPSEPPKVADIAMTRLVSLHTQQHAHTGDDGSLLAFWSAH